MSINIHKEPAIISNTIQQNTINATCVYSLQLDFVSITHMTIIICSLDRNSTQTEEERKKKGRGNDGNSFMLKSRHLRLHITHRENGKRESMLTWHAQVIKVAFTSLIRSVSRTSIAGFALFAFVYARE